MKYLFLIISASLLFSCSKFEDFKNAGTSADGVIAYKAKTIVSASDLKKIYISAPKNMVNIGKTLAKGDFLFINEINKGIHVYDNRTLTTPKPLAFINIPASKDFIIKNDILFADNGKDFISVNIVGLKDLLLGTISIKTIADSTRYFEVLARKTDIFKFENYPLQKGVYFVCPDSINNLGSYILDWQKDTLDKKPNCFR